MAVTSMFISLLLGLPVMVLSAWFVYNGHQQPVILIASIFFFFICLTDIFYTKIPNLLNLALLLSGLAYNAYSGGLAGVGSSLLGALTGLALFLIPYALGMGAGDVKALSALGALLGPSGVFEVFLYTALFGGVLAILHYLLTPQNWQNILAAFIRLRVFIDTRDIQMLKPDPQRGRHRFPYSAAIALGFFAFIQWGSIVKLLPR